MLLVMLPVQALQALAQLWDVRAVLQHSLHVAGC
jgi:hypothetical protein